MYPVSGFLFSQPLLHPEIWSKEDCVVLVHNAPRDYSSQISLWIEKVF